METINYQLSDTIIATVGSITILVNGREGTIFQDGLEVGGVILDQLCTNELVIDDVDGAATPATLVWIGLDYCTGHVFPPCLTLTWLASEIADFFNPLLGMGDEF
jgi:hypothetical protein